MSSENDILKQQVKDLLKALEDSPKDSELMNRTLELEHKSQEIDELTHKNQEMQDRCQKLEGSYQGLLNEYERLQRQHDDEMQSLQDQIQDLENALDEERTKGETSMNDSTRTIEELHQLRNMLEGQERSMESLERENGSLKSRMEQLKNEYQQSITQLQESLQEKEVMYEESVVQFQQVKDLLETRSNVSTPLSGTCPPDVNFQERLETEVPVRSAIFSGGDSTFETPIKASTAESLESASVTWDESGWEDENVLPESEQPRPHPVAANIDQLNEELVQLQSQVQNLQEEKEEVKQHKDTVIARLKGKLRSTIAERDQLRKEIGDSEALSQSLHEMISERDELKIQLESSATIPPPSTDELETVKSEMEALKARKDEVITKLKVKLKQTMRLKENLQTEVERVSNEKDVVFNEFSLKMQQQNEESIQLKSTNKQLQQQVETKTEEINQITESIKNKTSECDGLKLKCSELEAENEKLTEELESKESDLTEKFEWEASEKDDRLLDLERELKAARNDKEEWEEVRKTLEEALQVNEEAVSKMKETQDGLYRENAKLNAQLQSVDHKSQAEVDEYVEKIKKLEDDVSAEKKAKEDERIKSGEIKTQVEAVEILFGLSDNADLSLVERLSDWKQQSMDENKTRERSLKEMEFEKSDIKRSTISLEKLLSIKPNDDATLASRLDDIKQHVSEQKNEMDSVDDQQHEELATVKSQNTQLLERLNALEESKSQRIEEDHQSKSKIENLNSEIVEKSKKLDEVTQQLTEKTSENEDLLEEIQELKEEIQELKEEISDLREQLEDVFTMQKHGDSKDGSDDVITSDQFTLDALNESTKKFREKLAKQGAEIADLKSILLANSSQLREKDHAISLKEDRIAQLLRDVESSRNKMNESNEHINRLSAINDEMMKEKTLHEVTIFNF